MSNIEEPLNDLVKQIPSTSQECRTGFTRRINSLAVAIPSWQDMVEGKFSLPNLPELPLEWTFASGFQPIQGHERIAKRGNPSWLEDRRGFF